MAMIDPRKLDVRTVERHIQSGRIERAAYEKHLESLPDLAESSEFVDYANQFHEEAKAEEAEAEAEAEAERAAPPPETPVAEAPAEPGSAAPAPTEGTPIV